MNALPVGNVLPSLTFPPDLPYPPDLPDLPDLPDPPHCSQNSSSTPTDGIRGTMRSYSPVASNVRRLIDGSA